MMILAEKDANPQSGQMGTSDEPLIERAMTAHRRASLRSEGRLITPGKIQVVEDDGKQYVVLWYPGYRDSIISVYRVRAYDGVLRLMKRAPVALRQQLVEARKAAYR
jgi:hypothetical protein